MWCAEHGENHPLPSQGVDLYVGSYSHAGSTSNNVLLDAEAFAIGVQTIAYLTPTICVLDMGPEHVSSARLDECVQTIRDTSGARYVFYQVGNLCSARHGYPMQKTIMSIKY